MPHTIALDSRGRLFVGDRANNRIQIFDQNGTFIDEWTQFGRPSGIAITRNDTIYVADSEFRGPDEPGWKKGIRIGSARDGSVKYFIEDIESTTDDHSGRKGSASTVRQRLRLSRAPHDAREAHPGALTSAAARYCPALTPFCPVPLDRCLTFVRRGAQSLAAPVDPSRQIAGNPFCEVCR